MSPFYPTLVSTRMVDTVNFYEDYFGFEPVVEQEGYILMRRRGNPEVCIAVFDSKHHCVSNVVPNVQGVIVNIIEEDVKGKYDDLYMEGLEIYKDLGSDINGNDHFIVYDPNGIMVNIHAPMTLA